MISRLPLMYAPPCSRHQGIELTRIGCYKTKLEKTCNNKKNLSKIQLEHEKEDELVMVVVKVTLRGSGREPFWEEGDDFGVDVLRFHTCLTDILGFLKKLECCFEQDVDDEGEEDEEGKGGSKERKIMSEMIRYHFRQHRHLTEEIRMDDLEWWKRSSYLIHKVFSFHGLIASFAHNEERDDT
nr:hypothetical protein [Tanacetum cinerariifolium]GEZ07264.1 hypothetical protein [Tanacetum cinerariifolium]